MNRLYWALDDDWRGVPEKVAALTHQGRPLVSGIRKLVKLLAGRSPGISQVYWHPESSQLFVSLPHDADESTHNRWSNGLRAIRGVKGVQVDREFVPSAVDDCVRIKTAVPLGFIAEPFARVNQALGGTPLSKSIVGGLTGAGLGYAGGYLAEHLFPERLVQRGRLRKNLAVLGAALGSAPGVWQGSAYGRNDGTGFMQGMVTPQTAPVKPPAPVKLATTRLVTRLADIGLDARFVKASQIGANTMFENQAGGLDVESIPVDAFNQVVWNDVRRGTPASANPFGSKSPWGTNAQTLHTPPAVAAATTGLLSGIQALHGDAPMLSPLQIIHGLAGAGVGLATANVVGRTLSALAGLTPAAQTQLQSSGAFAGLLLSVIPSLFGR